MLRSPLASPMLFRPTLTRSNLKPVAALCLCASLLMLPTPADAGLIANVLRATGVDSVLQSLSRATGIALEAPVASLDSLASELAPGATLPTLLLTPEQSQQLAMMDLSEDEFRRLQAFANAAPVAVAVSLGGNDQPAVTENEALDPRYQGGRIQNERNQCADSDNDGVCDEDDQCLKTPAGAWVIGNGCHIEGPVRLRFDPLVFRPASAELSEAAQYELTQVVAAMNRHPSYQLAVVGYTDASGDRGENKRLSQDRAKATRDFLVAQGLSPTRLRVAGLGEARPRGDNSTEVGRAKNRRVELIIIESDRASGASPTNPQ